MKTNKLAVAFVTAIIAALLLSACFSSWQGDEGTFTISVGGGNERAAPWPLNPETISRMEHTIKLSGGPGPEQTTSFTGSQTVQFTVAPGAWNIAVEARLNGVLEATGSWKGNIKSGNNGAITITMSGQKPDNQYQIKSAAIKITQPMKDMEPNVTANSEDSRFSISPVTWSSEDEAWDPNLVFKGNAVYTAKVTLIAESGYTFIDEFSATINSEQAGVTDNTGSSVTLVYTFPKISDRTVTGIEIIEQPKNLTYSHGDALDLTGLVVKLIFTDGSTEEVAFGDFKIWGITTFPPYGEPLSRPDHDGYKVEVSCGDCQVETDDRLTVNKAAGANVGKPEAYSNNSSSITINAVELVVDTYQEIEYAIKKTGEGDPDESDWNYYMPANGRVTFTGLSAGTSYCVYARSKANDNYYAGAISKSDKIPTTDTDDIYDLTLTVSIEDIIDSGSDLIFTNGSGVTLNVDSVDSIVIYLNSTPKTATIKIQDAGSYGIEWWVGDDKIGMGDLLTLNATDFDTVGTKFLTVIVTIDDILYSREIEFKVAQ